MISIATEILSEQGRPPVAVCSQIPKVDTPAFAARLHGDHSSTGLRVMQKRRSEGGHREVEEGGAVVEEIRDLGDAVALHVQVPQSCVMHAIRG